MLERIRNSPRQCLSGRANLDMNNLPFERQVAVVAALVEGNSIRATVRMTGVAKDTVTKLLAELAERALSISARRFAISLAQKSSAMKFGSSATPRKRMFRRSCAVSLAMLKCGRGPRFAPIPRWSRAGVLATATRGTRNIYVRSGVALTNRVQLTTDGHRAYLQAVEQAFGNEIDYAMLVKIYGTDRGK